MGNLQLAACQPTGPDRKDASNSIHEALSFSLGLLCSVVLAIGWSACHSAPNPIPLPKTTPGTVQSPTRATLVKEGLEKLASGRPEEALLDAQKAISLDAYSAEAYYLRARAAHDIGLKQEALKDYDKAIAIDPRFTKALVNRALIKGGLGNLKGALTDLNAAIAIDPTFATAFSNRGVTRGALNDRKGAISDFNKAVKLNPRYADAYRNRGITREMMGDLNGACADWKIASSLGQKDTQAWYIQQCKL